MENYSKIMHVNKDSDLFEISAVLSDSDYDNEFSIECLSYQSVIGQIESKILDTLNNTGGIPKSVQILSIEYDVWKNKRFLERYDGYIKVDTQNKKVDFSEHIDTFMNEFLITEVYELTNPIGLHINLHKTDELLSRFSFQMYVDFNFSENDIKNIMGLEFYLVYNKKYKSLNLFASYLYRDSKENISIDINSFEEYALKQKITEYYQQISNFTLDELIELNLNKSGRHL